MVKPFGFNDPYNKNNTLENKDLNVNDDDDELDIIITDIVIKGSELVFNTSGIMKLILNINFTIKIEDKIIKNINVKLILESLGELDMVYPSSFNKYKNNADIIECEIHDLIYSYNHGETSNLLRTTIIKYINTLNIQIKTVDKIYKYKV